MNLRVLNGFQCNENVQMKLRILAISFVVCIIFSIAGFIAATQGNAPRKVPPLDTQVARPQKLEDFSIDIMRPHSEKFGYSPNFIPEPKTCLFLNNPKNGNRVVLVLIKRDGSVFLNPTKKELQSIEFDYGPIPRLKNFTTTIADRLFGTAETTSPAVRTYSLVVNGTNQPCRMDLQFSGNRLVRCRIRHLKLVSENWIDVTRS